MTKPKPGAVKGRPRIDKSKRRTQHTFYLEPGLSLELSVAADREGVSRSRIAERALIAELRRLRLHHPPESY